METFSELLALCVGNSPVNGEFSSQRPVTRSFDVSLDMRLNKRWSEQSSGWSFETPSRSSWRHYNALCIIRGMYCVSTFLVCNKKKLYKTFSHWTRSQLK